MAPGFFKYEVNDVQRTLMRLVVNQPNYIPWRGYFDLMDDADLFLFHDDAQYTKQDWRNRNRIKTRQGVIWLTVPVMKVTTDTLIKDVLINHSEDWILSHQRQLTTAYHQAPYFKDYAEDFFTILHKKHEKLLDLTIETTRFVMKALGIDTPVCLVSDLNLGGKKTEKLINILRACGGDTYISGPAAKAYIDENMFSQAGIKLSWKNYTYDPYPQLHGIFEPHVSILDLLFNCGPGARSYVKSKIAIHPTDEST